MRYIIYPADAFEFNSGSAKLIFIENAYEKFGRFRAGMNSSEANHYTAKV